MKVEEFAEGIIEHIVEHQCCLQDQLDTLKRMRDSSSPTHVKNYWKVCQAVAERGMMLLERRILLDPFFLRFASVHTLCYAGCTTAVLRRLLKYEDTLFQQLREMLHRDDVVEFHDNAQGALTLIYRCLLIGKHRDALRVIKCGIVTDAYSLSKDVLAMDPLKCKFPDMLVMVASAKLLEFLAETGNSEIHKHLKKQDKAFNQLFRTLPRNMSSKMSSESKTKQIKIMLECVNMYYNLLNGKEEKGFGFSAMSKSKRLAREFDNNYFVFCSLPSCRQEKHADGILMHCSACMLARYCNVQCQKSHWDQGHKIQCQMLSPFLS